MYFFAFRRIFWSLGKIFTFENDENGVEDYDETILAHFGGNEKYSFLSVKIQCISSTEAIKARLDQRGFVSQLKVNTVENYASVQHLES